MKKTLIATLALVAGVAVAAPEASKPSAKEAPKPVAAADANKSVKSGLVAARAQIANIIANPKTMTVVMKTLPPAEQVTFVGDVNKAIGKMSVPENDRSAICLNINRAALDGAAKGNLAPVVAEVFATAPITTLAVINESFAQTAFNRAADPKVTYTDEQYIQVSKGVMKTIVDRLETAKDSGVRGGFAALMMVRASNSESPAIQEAIVSTLPESVQETAKEEWLPTALATDERKSYDPMLGMVEAELSRPVNEQVLNIAGPQQSDAMLADLTGAATDPNLSPSESDPVTDAVFAPTQHDLPQLNGVADVTEVVGEVKGYQGQTTK